MTADDKPLHIITVGKRALTIRDRKNGNSQNFLDLEDCDSSSRRTGKLWNNKAGLWIYILYCIIKKILSLSRTYAKIFLLKQLLKKKSASVCLSIYLSSFISIFIYTLKVYIKLVLLYIHLFVYPSPSIYLYIYLYLSGYTYPSIFLVVQLSIHFLPIQFFIYLVLYPLHL